MKNPIRRILVIKPSSLGDIIHALLVVERIKQENLDLQVDWVVRDIFAPFIQASKTVDHHHVFYRKGGSMAFFQLITAIREEAYDAVLDMQGLVRSGVLTQFSAVPRLRRYGRGDARELAWLACGHLSAWPQEASRECPPHAVEILKGFLTFFGIDPSATLAPLAFRSDGVSEIAREVLASGRELLLLFPESRRPEKEWKGFAELTDLLLASEAFDTATGKKPLVCWLGSTAVDDGGRADGEAFINLTGRTTLGDLPALVQAASVVVANDSGPMHLAAALMRKVVALFGPTDPRLYGPYPLESARHRVLRAQDGELTSIRAAQVAEAVIELRRI